MGIDLRLGDCLEIMPTLEAQSFEAIIADIPYGTTACSWDTVIPLAPMWEQLKRLAKPRAAIVLFGSQPFTSALVMSNLQMFRYEWSWNKVNMFTNQMNAKRMPMRGHENILIFSANGHTYNPQKRQGKPYKTRRSGNIQVFSVAPRDGENKDGLMFPNTVIEIPARLPNEQGLHPTQKPVALMEYLIRTYTNEGDTVLDFTMGSGTTMVACVNTNRNGVGIELREDYFAIAQRRIADAQAQLTLPMVTV